MKSGNSQSINSDSNDTVRVELLENRLDSLQRQIDLDLDLIEYHLNKIDSLPKK